MTKILAAAAALAMMASSGAWAATAAPTIKAGQYAGTLQFTNVQDPYGFCASLVAIGEVQTSVGTFKLGAAPIVATPLTGSATTAYGVGQQVCTYAPLPAALTAGGSTAINGTTTCTVPNPTFPTAKIVTTGSNTGGGVSSSTINSVSANTFKITTLNAALEVEPGGPGTGFQPICYISTDSLFLRSGV